MKFQGPYELCKRIYKNQFLENLNLKTDECDSKDIEFEPYPSILFTHLTDKDYWCSWFSIQTARETSGDDAWNFPGLK